MDVGDVLPDGDSILNCGALSGRRCRLEVQFETCLEVPASGAAPLAEVRPSSEVLPYRLRVERPDGSNVHVRWETSSRWSPAPNNASVPVGVRFGIHDIG